MENKARLQELPPLLTEEELGQLSRQESLSRVKMNKNRTNLEDTLKKNEQTLKETKDSIKVRQRLHKEFIRILPLGYDRLHRRYWYFYNSLNKGIYVEEGWYTQDYRFFYEDSSVESDDESDIVEQDDLFDMMKRATNFSVPTIMPVHWRSISNQEELIRFIETLTDKGVRESALKKKLNEIKEDFGRSLSTGIKRPPLPIDYALMTEFKVSFLIFYTLLNQNHFLHMHEEDFANQLEQTDNLDDLKNKLCNAAQQTITKSY